MKTTLKQTTSLKPYDKNPRINNHAVDAVARSIEQFGFRQPIVVDKGGVIIVGHTRWKAAQLLNIDKVPVHVAEDLSPAKVKALRIADNQTATLASWDFDLLPVEIQALEELDEDFDLSLLGFSNDELEKIRDGIRATDGLTDPDEIPEAPAKAITKKGELIILGPHRLLCGDSTQQEDVARLMDGTRADCVFTSPPYAVGIDYGEYKDTIDNLRAMLPHLSARWHEVVVDGGYAVINFGDICAAKDDVGTEEPCEYPMALEYWPVFRSDGWVLWSRRAWCKAASTSMQCITSNRARPDSEHLWTWKRPGKALHQAQTTGEYVSQLGYVMSPSGGAQDVAKEEHAATMPVHIAEHCVSIHSRRGHVIHEPFTGSGTTMIAAEKLGRRCYGMELSPIYCDIAVMRWEEFTGEKAKRIKGKR